MPWWVESFSHWKANTSSFDFKGWIRSSLVTWHNSAFCLAGLSAIFNVVPPGLNLIKYFDLMVHSCPNMMELPGVLQPPDIITYSSRSVTMVIYDSIYCNHPRSNGFLTSWIRSYSNVPLASWQWALFLWWLRALGCWSTLPAASSRWWSSTRGRCKSWRIHPMSTSWGWSGCWKSHQGVRIVKTAMMWCWLWLFRMPQCHLT